MDINLFKKQRIKTLNVFHFKGTVQQFNFGIFDFFFSTQSICRHQGSISLFGTDLVLGLLTKVIDASRSENVSKKLRILETFSVTFDVIRFY